MMHGRPNDPEYCQGIYDAAKKVVAMADGVESSDSLSALFLLFQEIANLKRALDGKDSKP